MLEPPQTPLSHWFSPSALLTSLARPSFLPSGATVQGGFRTCIVSTDPAHSLGDALGLALPPGKLTAVPGVHGGGQGVCGKGDGEKSGGGSVHALEVDTAAALAEFQQLVRTLAKSAGAGPGGSSGGGGLLGSLDLGSFAEALETAPPGMDELAALAQVLALVRETGGSGPENGVPALRSIEAYVINVLLVVGEPREALYPSVPPLPPLSLFRHR